MPDVSNLSAEIDNFFRAVVGRPAEPYRRKIIQNNVDSAARMKAHNTICDIVAPAKDAFHAMGDSLCNYLLILREHQPNSPLLTRIAAALVRVVMHLSDCARYEEKPVRAVAFAEYIRTLCPENAEAHMRIGLSLPLIPTRPNGATSLKAFYHFCVYLANRAVDVSSPPAQVVHIAAKNASNRVRALERQISPPDKIDIFAERFISACWTTLTCEDMMKVHKAVLILGNAELWKSAREFVATGDLDERQEEIESALLHAVGIAIFVRYRLTRKGNFDRAVCPKRIAAADALLRNFAAVLCEAVTTDLVRVRGRVRNRKKNRRRFFQKKRKKPNAVNPPNHSPEVLGMMCLNDRVAMSWVPPAMGPLSILLHFWSKTLESIIEVQLGPFVEFYRQLKQLLLEFTRFQEVSGTTEYLERVRSLLVSHSEVPSLNEDLYLCNFRACKNQDLFRNIVVQKIVPPTFLKGDSNGMLDRAVAELMKANQRYETVVGPASVRHLEAFGQQVAKKLRSTIPTGVMVSSTTSNFLVMLALRKQRISRMADVLRTYKCGLIGIETTPRAPAGTPLPPVQDVLDTQPNDSEGLETCPLPGQLKRRYVRFSSQECNPAERERNLGKRRRLIGSEPVASLLTDRACSSEQQDIETSPDQNLRQSQSVN